ncbi:MAG: MraY family glycosyltransferase [Tepidisphaeraceae bacterium]|jgi:UDP-GlcNAc:undecaprenyl-phosphate GlcNAc-1-phosphate transferase
MTRVILSLIPISFAISWLLTRLMRILSIRIGFTDKPGHRKIHASPKPLGGGIAIYWGFTLPVLIGLFYVNHFDPPGFLHASDRLAAYWSGARQQTPLALLMIFAALLIHLLGLWDDRKSLGPYFKLIVQLTVVTILVAAADLRALTFLDHALPFGRWSSIAATVLWIVAVTNAFNFLDNMDGLSAGVASVCATAFLFTTLSIGQWFVAAALALLLGSLLGFLWHNFPPAKIFMGDAGSLVTGLLLGILTVRTTYLPPGAVWANRWYAVFAPVIVLALPLYDLIVVSFLRMLHGKSPFVGDANHFSHRLVARGMSRRTAVLCLYLVSAATSIAAILLPRITGDFALLIFLQTLLILAMVALLEQHPLPTENDQQK